MRTSARCMFCEMHVLHSCACATCNAWLQLGGQCPLPAHQMLGMVWVEGVIVTARCTPVQAGLISAEDIIIDAKSGVSGAGRSAKQNLLYTEIAEGINCYGVGSHRHMPEIEQARH